MFEKILIANRGEIACRVIRSCQQLGVATVAVYSDADADALHVRMADERVRLGPPPAAQSYLLIDKIVAACRQTGAQAVHPGYGFLSERAAFAEALAGAGVAFSGPPVAAIEAMGDKIESKRLARQAGVSTVPGTLDAIADVAEAKRIAAEIGYPVMIKASAGGGGKGMRIAHSEDELQEGLERARSEAKSSFGDDRCFIEKFVVEPRHIEIQVLGDKHGNTIYLGERECSIQRRHQKVIEEAPSPFLDEATRRAMGEQAVALASAVDYHSAGTVEFIVDKDRNFYFLEMNTRLQVEHPVTELVTGVDLVEQMIRIAAGERLQIRQADVALTGWAIEARVYAEDPARGFLPSTGRLKTYREPVAAGVRVDSGVFEGGEVSMHYDPMIAKLCAFAATRDEAADRLQDAIDHYAIRGPGHNLNFLSALLGHPRFRAGRLTTNFIAEEFGAQYDGVQLDPAALRRLLALAAVMEEWMVRRAAGISGQLARGIAKRSGRYVVSVDDTAWSVAVAQAADGEGAEVTIDDQTLAVTTDWRPGRHLATATIDGVGIAAPVERLPEGFVFDHRGARIVFKVQSQLAYELTRRMPPKVAPDSSRQITSPMPGLIVRLDVSEGQEIKAGQELLILEAMKMENVLRAERDGRIARILVAPGATVGADELLVELA